MMVGMKELTPDQRKFLNKRVAPIVGGALGAVVGILILGLISGHFWFHLTIAVVMVGWLVLRFTTIFSQP